MKYTKSKSVLRKELPSVGFQDLEELGNRHKIKT